MKSDLNGIFPPIPTPFENEDIALDKLSDNIQKWNDYHLKGYLALGSNGESAYLSYDEKLKVVETTVNSAGKNKIIIAGTGLESIKDTIALTNNCSDLGVNYALVLTPSYFKSKMTHEAFISYYTEIADSSTIPIILYNVPKFTGVDMDVNTVVELSHHPNIVGIKNSSENIRQLGEFIHRTPDEFSVLVGTASILFSGFILGADGGIVSLANIAPDECIKIHQLCSDLNIDAARELQFKLIDPNTAVTSKFGVAGLKKIMDEIGFYGGPPRKPLTTLSQTEFDLLKIMASPILQ